VAIVRRALLVPEIMLQIGRDFNRYLGRGAVQKACRMLISV
jgi:hypothetical protein